MDFSFLSTLYIILIWFYEKYIGLILWWGRYLP